MAYFYDGLSCSVRDKMQWLRSFVAFAFALRARQTGAPQDDSDLSFGENQIPHAKPFEAQDKTACGAADQKMWPVFRDPGNGHRPSFGSD
jgi:hypothetical protein